jgi:CHAT domain-containing protein
VALPYLRDAAALCRRIQPGTPFLAYELGLLGMAEGAVGNRQEGLRLLKEALAITEQLYQRPSAGGWGDGAEAGVPDVHFNYADLLIKDGQPEAAFDVVEKARARAMLNLLAARAQRDSAAVPEALRRERRRREIELDQKRAQIAALSTATDGQAIEAATIELNEIQMRLGDVVRRIAEADPRAAALERPSPLTLADARSRLDAGTVLLSYFVGAKETLLFVVTPPATTPAGGPGLTVHRLPATASELQDSVEAFSRLIEWETDPAQANRPARIGRGRELYALLIRPAENSIAAAERVLINPDGPLYGLPFGALQRDTAKGPQHLIAWKPLHTTMSMSVYAEVLRSRREHSGPGQIVAFGDPKYPAPAFKPADADLALLQRNGVNLAPLRGARREVTEIGRIFGAHAVTFLGEAATEARARSLGRSPRYIHFAAHAILSESQPLDSALVLTIPESPRPGEPNGILQTWEIFEHLRIDADLVTLSACETGLGRIFAGEGLVGLTRAFLYAGARTVAASLWKVGDGPTAELMTHFYTNLRRGLTKDEALRQAQLALIDKRSSPAHWAAFMLTGDWK